jgi:hypothetical protein
MGSHTALRCFVLIDIREYQDSSLTTPEYIFIATKIYTLQSRQGPPYNALEESGF